MTEPDDLYTLRAQYWLGHYNLAVEEAKSVARRPMSPALKAEREEFLVRSHLALGALDKATTPDSNDTPGLKALSLKARYEAARGNESAQENVLTELKTLISADSSPSVQLAAAQVFFSAGLTKEALQCVHGAATMEHQALQVQIYLKIDRLDLAQQQLAAMRKVDEDSILTQLCSVYINLYTGSTGAADAIHSLSALSEQYGQSPLLLNLLACAAIQQGDYVTAEAKLQECLRDHAVDIGPHQMIDTYINLIVAATHQKKEVDEYISEIRTRFPTHPFCAGLDRVIAAIDRESIKYKT